VNKITNKEIKEKFSLFNKENVKEKYHFLLHLTIMFYFKLKYNKNTKSIREINIFQNYISFSTINM